MQAAQSAFFSYSRDDSEFAIRLAEDLKAAGANVWIDQLDIQPGTEWDLAVENAVNSCPRMLVILSPTSVKSTNVLDEVSFALKKKKTVIPVLYLECEVPFRLHRLQHIDFRTDYARGLKRLLKILIVEQQSGVAEQAEASATSGESLAEVSNADERKGRVEEGLEEEHKQAEQAGSAPEPDVTEADKGERAAQDPRRKTVNEQSQAAEQARLDQERRHSVPQAGLHDDVHKAAESTRLDEDRKSAKEQARLERQHKAAEEKGLRTEREQHNVATDEQAKAPEEKHTSGFHSRGVRFFSELPVRSIVACSILILGLIVALILYRAYERGGKPPNYPMGTIEMKYYAPGRWAVTEETGGPCCDSLGNKYDLYYPTPLGAGGFKHPILTWGNGSLEKPSQVAYLLKHMASWGFVVIASEDQMTGPGQSILDAAKFLVSANSDSTSIFFGKLDVSQVGAFGHSQGAGGAINALIKSGGLIKTVIPIELPAQISCGPTPCPDTSRLTTGSVFFIDGSSDIPKSPPTQPPGTPGEQSIEAYYHAVPRGVAKVKGTLIGPGPNDVTGQPDCSTAVPPCENGVYGYLGYPTAWMMYQLQNDNYAHGAFVNQTGEMFSQVVNWAFVASNIP